MCYFELLSLIYYRINLLQWNSLYLDQLGMGSTICCWGEAGMPLRIWQKFSSYSCCKCEQMSVPKESKQVTFVHSTYLFSVYLITVYLMHDVHHILTQKQCEGFMLNLKANQRLFYFQCLWINFTCFLSVQVQLTEGYDYAGTLWIEGKKAHQYYQKLVGFLGSWMSVNLVHWV